MEDYKQRRPQVKQASKNRNIRHKKKKNKRKLNKKNLWALILSIFVVIEFIGIGSGAILWNKMLETKPDLEINDFLSPESSRIFDENGKTIADVGVQLRENVKYNDLSESIIDCFLATEDSRYFTHDGFDKARFAKAILENLKTMHFTQGGSTFTMQLVKVTYFTNDETGERRKKSIEYKVQQISLARELEKKANKKQIFELYLNKLNFGGNRNIRGIQKAADYYYGKTADELNLPEAAMLAGVINSPYYYDPHNFLDYATKRRNTVLYLMLRHGYITKNEYNLAKNVKVEDLLADPNASSGGPAFAYQSYIDVAIQEAERLTGQDPLNTAMDIYTYMKPSVQKVVDDIQAGKVENVKFPDELIECGMITENNQTGEIVAIGGGRNYGRGGAMLLNHAIDQYKQPGSAVKPVIDYAMAFEYLGWSTSHVVTDEPINYRGTDIVIKNANGKYYGQVPLARAIGISLNTPAIMVLQNAIDKAGWQTVVNYIMSLGFSKVNEQNFDLGFAIGGSAFVCSCEELMAANAVLMNGGNYIKPHTISKIVFRHGAKEPVIQQVDKINVLTPQAAFLTAQLMHETIYGPYFNYMQILQRNYPTYAKTGTSDWGKEGVQYNIPVGAAKDKWMVCQTSQYTTCTWVGYEKAVKDQQTYFSSSTSQLNIPGNICSTILNALHKDSAPEPVQKPDGVVEITHILGTYPYAEPIEGMDEDYITTGYIKEDKAKLVNPEKTHVDTLDSFDAYLDANGDITFNWAPYPDPEKLEVASKEMEMELVVDDEVLARADGERVFDYSWIFGPIQYKAIVKQNGITKAVISSDESLHSEHVDLDPFEKVEVTGFYGYEKIDDASNEITVSFDGPDSFSLDTSYSF